MNQSSAVENPGQGRNPSSFVVVDFKDVPNNGYEIALKSWKSAGFDHVARAWDYLMREGKRQNSDDEDAVLADLYENCSWYDEYIGWAGKQITVVGEGPDWKPKWREQFRTGSELDQRPLEFVIDRLVPQEGITGIGGLSGHGKTFVMMSMAKTICSGGYLWRRFKTNQHRVLYLTPECGDKSFHHRMELLQMPDAENFLVRTMSQGMTLPLSSQDVRDAAKGRVVFLDTLPRFIEGRDEQQARDMAALGEDLLGLLKAGAVAVVFAHHSPKHSRKEEEMNLENVFRGSGDIGAVMSAGHGVRMLDQKKTLIQIECVKPRDFEPWAPFQLEGRPSIGNYGDFRMVKKPGECRQLAEEQKEKTHGELSTKILDVIRKQPGLSGSKIFEKVGGNRNRCYAVLEEGVATKLWAFDEKGNAKKYHAVE